MYEFQYNKFMFIIINYSNHKRDKLTMKYNVNDCVGFGVIHNNSGSTFSLHTDIQIASCTIIGILKMNK